MAAAPSSPSRPIRHYYRGDKEVDEQCDLKSLHFALDEKTGVATITLNAPEKLNALSRNLIFEMLLVIEYCKRDEKVRALLWTGAGRAFSSGADFVDQSLAHDEEVCHGYQTAGRGYMPTEGGAPNDMALKCVVVLMLELEKPSVCAVNGLAVGGTVNFALLLHDFVFAAEEAKFKYPFTSLGLTPEVGSSFILPAIVGMPTAKKWIMLGDWFSAQEAKEAGIISSVLPQAELLPKARALAERLAENSETIGLQKRAMHGNSWQRMKDAMDHENTVIGVAARSPAFFKAMSSFSKKHDKGDKASSKRSKL